MAVFLKNATLVDWKTFDFTAGHFAVTEGAEGTVTALAALPDKDALAAGDTVLDCAGKLVTRAFACGHHHVYSALARGMPPPKHSPSNFHEVLQYVWWTLDKLLDREMIEASALVTALYCAKNGVTFVVDHHASPLAVPGSLSAIADAFDKVGVSHLLCYELSDRDGPKSAREGLEETASYLASGRQGLVGLHASFTVGDDLLKAAVRLAGERGTGVHVHVAEDPVDQARCLAEHGKRVVVRYRDAGVLALPRSVYAHCLHLDDEERKLLSDAGAWIAQNTESNLNNNVGMFRSQGLGANVMLGTDGMHSDMLRSAKAAFLVGQQTEGLSFPGAYERFRRVHEYLRQGGFTGDGPNNLVVLDYNSPTDVTPGNFLGHFVYGLDSAHVESVVSSGRLIVKDRKLLTADEGEILGFSREQGRRLWARMLA